MDLASSAMVAAPPIRKGLLTTGSAPTCVMLPPASAADKPSGLSTSSKAWGRSNAAVLWQLLYARLRRSVRYVMARPVIPHASCKLAEFWSRLELSQVVVRSPRGFDARNGKGRLLLDVEMPNAGAISCREHLGPWK